MKKLTQSYQEWLLHRSYSEAKKQNKKKNNEKRPINSTPRPRIDEILKENRYRKVVQIWKGDETEEVLCIRKPYQPPTEICFDKNSFETLNLLERVRDGFSDLGSIRFVHREKGKADLPIINGYIDFSNINLISTSAAVALAAEYQRAAHFSKEIPPAIELDSWKSSVFTKLFQIGFFETVGLSQDVANRLYEEGETRTMRIISGANSTKIMRTVDEQLRLLGEFIDGGQTIGGDLLVPLLSVISEATTNVTQHAYSEKPDLSKVFPQFWVSAAADRVQRSLTIVVYDQGRTIPVTYPREGMSDKLNRLFSWVIRKRAYGIRDDDYIVAALRYGNSRTDLPHRGKGLPQMRQLIRNLGRGSLVVRSGRGWCRCGPSKKVESGESQARLRGTLVEWNLELP